MINHLKKQSKYKSIIELTSSILNHFIKKSPIDMIDHFKKQSTHKSIKELTISILNHFNIKKVPVDIVLLCRQFGIRVFEGTKTSFKYVDEKYHITISNNFTYAEKRCLIARSLGMILLDDTNECDYKVSEWELSEFVENLLVPLWAIDENIIQLSSMSEGCSANFFEVPETVFSKQYSVYLMGI